LSHKSCPFRVKMCAEDADTISVFSSGEHAEVHEDAAPAWGVDLRLKDKVCCLIEAGHRPLAIIKELEKLFPEGTPERGAIPTREQLSGVLPHAAYVAQFSRCERACMRKLHQCAQTATCAAGLRISSARPARNSLMRSPPIRMD
jgi:hypothetical protein